MIKTKIKSPENLLINIEGIFQLPWFYHRYDVITVIEAPWATSHFLKLNDQPVVKFHWFKLKEPYKKAQRGAGFRPHG